MKLLGLALTFFFISSLSFAQDFDKIFRALDLDPSIYDTEMAELISYENADGDSLTDYAMPLEGDVFRFIAKSVSQNHKIEQITLGFRDSSKAYNQYLDLYDNLETALGEPYYSLQEDGKENHYFWDGDVFLEVRGLKKGKYEQFDLNPEIVIRGANYEIKEVFHETKKYSTLTIESFLPDIKIDNKKFYIDFEGIVTSQYRDINWVITCISDKDFNMVSIQLMTSDWEVFEYDLQVIRYEMPDGRKIQSGGFTIDKDVYDKVKSQKDLKIRLKGEQNYEIPFLEPVYKDLIVLGNEVYKYE